MSLGQFRFVLCDVVTASGCLVSGPEARTAREARRLARAAGWTSDAAADGSGTVDVCPACTQAREAR